MSIKKCIMNYFDKATNAMIPFHPQTESGAITDWHESIIGSLASKVLPTVVSELTTDSVLGKLMKMLLTASGVKYSIDTNGFVCLGSFFGGLIIQWGTGCVITNNTQGIHYISKALPITATTFLQGAAVYDYPSVGSYPVCALIADGTTVTIGAQLLPGYTGSPVNIRWIGIFQ